MKSRFFYGIIITVKPIYQMKEVEIMSEHKIDRRAMKTRKAIFEALAELLCEKELRQITVQEISDKSDVHRVTIYKHFMDIYDIYEQLEKLILSEIGLLITEYGEKATFEFYPVFFKYITDNPKIFKMIFSPNNTSTLYMKLLNMVEGLNRVIWSEKYNVDIHDSRIQYIIRYHSNGCLAIIGGWVLSDFAQSQDFITKTLSGLDKSTQQYFTTMIK